MFEYFHVSLKSNLDSILKNGLIPQVGPRTNASNDIKAVYLFTCLEDMENALWNWLGDEFEDEDELVVLKVVLDRELSVNGYESVCFDIIGPDCIEYFRDE